MSQQMPFEIQDARLRDSARAFVYPPTPDIAGTVRRRLQESQTTSRGLAAPFFPRRRAVWVAFAVGLALLVTAVLTVPEVGAFVRYIFRIGAIEVVIATPTPKPSGNLTPIATATPAPLAGFNLAGETTLEAAQQMASFPVRLPSYPSGLGKPDRVFMQDLTGDALILVWLQPGHRDQARMSLFELNGDYGQKVVKEVTKLQETQVHGQQALWIRGPYTLRIFDRSGQPIWERGQLVEGNALVWTEEGVTYKLESTLTLQEAVKVAESLAAAPVTPAPTPPSRSVLDVAGETSLLLAQQQVRFTELPAYPSDLGKPDHVFVQDLAGPAVILVWTQPGHPDEVRLALYELVSAGIAEKTVSETTVLQETRVNDQKALWVRGPHLLEFFDQYGRHLEPGRLVDGNVLAWAKGAVTYRLETKLPLEEAVKIAESVK